MEKNTFKKSLSFKNIAQRARRGSITKICVDFSIYGMEFGRGHKIRKSLMGLIPALISLPKKATSICGAHSAIVVHDWSPAWLVP